MNDYRTTKYFRVIKQQFVNAWITLIVHAYWGKYSDMYKKANIYYETGIIWNEAARWRDRLKNRENENLLQALFTVESLFGSIISVQKIPPHPTTKQKPKQLTGLSDPWTSDVCGEIVSNGLGGGLHQSFIIETSNSQNHL